MNRYIIIAIVTLLACCSCSDSHDELPDLNNSISRSMFRMDVSSVEYSNGTASFTAKLSTLTDLDFWDLSIQSVEYYIDGEPYPHTSPFVINFRTDKWKGGETHMLNAKITILESDGKSAIVELSKQIKLQDIYIPGGESDVTEDFTFDAWFDFDYVTTGDLFRIEAVINEDVTTTNVNIKSVTFSWDGIEVEKTEKPYVYTREITELPGSKHMVTASIEYTVGQSGKTYYYDYQYPRYEIKSSKDVVFSYQFKSSKPRFKKTQMLRGVAKAFIGSDCSEKNYGVSLYIDDQLIGESMTFPYEHEYPLDDIPVGTHLLTQKFTTFTLDGRFMSSISSDTEFTVEE